MEILVELGFLTVAAVRVARVVAMPAVRRELREHPVLAVPLAVVVGAGLGIVVWAARESPMALRASVGLVAALWVLLAWRASPRFGRRRSLPPGSLGLGCSLEAIVDPDFYRHQARLHGPVFKMAQFHRPVACVVGLEKGRRLLRHPAGALEPAPLPLSDEVPRGFLRYMQPDDHERYSRLFRAAFSDTALAAVEPFAVAEVRRELGLLADASERAPATGLNPRSHLDGYLLTVLLRLFFGGLLHVEDRRVVEECSRDAAFANAVGRASPRARRALRRFERLLFERGVSYDAANDRSVWGELVRLEPATARDAIVAGNLFILLQASQESVGGLLVWIVKYLSSAPGWIARVRDTPFAEDDPFTRAVIETLRLAQSEYVYREVRQPIAIDEFVIPKGWLLRICVAESHRMDPPFARPDTFDPDRHRERRYTTDDLSPFGLDHHACLGARMSLLLGRVLAAALVNGFDLSVAADGPMERDNRHWNHWRPSAELRVVLRRREGRGPG